MIRVPVIAVISSILLVQGIVNGADASKKIVLSHNSKPAFTIVIPKSVSTVENNAVKDLKYYLDRITDGNFNIIIEDAGYVDGKCIYVGKTNALAEAFPDFNIDSLGTDGISIKTSQNGDIYICGKGDRGTLYAVYTFLEDFCGVRWWTIDEETVPSNSNLKIDAPNLTYTPYMDYRDAFYQDFNNFDGRADVDSETRFKFCARLKNNGFLNGLPDEWGSSTKCLPGAWPVFSQLMPTNIYFKDHPEWYSEINGKREPAQLCLTNEDMRKEMAHNLLELIKNTPGADMITITQNDSGKDDYCHCAKCMEEASKEKAQSGMLLQCVNAIAEIVEKEYPNVYVNTLAYAYNLEPPKVTRPRSNVSIQVCCPGDSSRFDSPDNEKFLKGLQVWSRMSNKMYAWTYQIDFGDILNPIPNAFNIGPDIKILAKNKVRGVFAQGNSYSAIGDFSELKAYVTAKMLWNPSLDDKKLIDNFLNAYYGKSAKPLHKYLELIANAYSKLSLQEKAKAFNHNAYATPPQLTPWLKLDTINKATKLFNEAEKLAADNTKYLERVQRVRMSIDFQWIIGWKEYESDSQTQNRPFLGPTDQRAAFDAFIQNCQKQGVHRLCEGNGSLSVLYGAIFGN